MAILVPLFHALEDVERLLEVLRGRGEEPA